MVLKFQQGGGFGFVEFNPLILNDQQQETPAKKTNNENQGLLDDQIKKLLGDFKGLPSDLQYIIGELQRFNINQQYGIDTGNSATQYLNILGKLKYAEFNNSEYEKTLEEISKNGGLNEIAISRNGLIYCMNSEKDARLMTVDQLSKQNEYKPLTNSELLTMRAHDPSLAFNSNLLSEVRNGIGMTSVNKMIQDIISHLGETSHSEEGYLSADAKRIISSLEDFKIAVQESDGKFDPTLNNLYKYNYITKNQADQIKNAMGYIYHTLPENAKTLLEYKARNIEGGMVGLLGMLLGSQNINSIDFKLDLEVSDSKKNSSNTKDVSELSTSFPLNVMKSIGGSDGYFQIDKGEGIQMSVKGTIYNLVKTPQGEPIVETSLLEMLTKSGLQSIVSDLRNIQFGDQKLSPEVLQNITYNNSGIMRVNLPVNPDGTVNLNILESFEQAENEINLLSNKSPEEIYQIYSKYGISELLNSDGTYNQKKFAPFIITEGYTTDALSGLKDSEFVKEYKGDENAAVDLIQRSLSIGSGKNTKIPKIDDFDWYNPADWFGWTDTIYKGVIYIPITNNVNSAVFGANQSIDYDEALIQEEKYQNFEKMSKHKSTSADILNI